MVVAVATCALFVIGASVAQHVSGPLHYERKPFELRLPLAQGGSTLLLYGLVLLHRARSERDLHDLVPQGRASFSGRATTLFGGPTRSAFWVATTAALVVGLAIQQRNTQRWTRFAAGDWNAFDVWSAAMVLYFGFLAFQAYAYTLSTALSMRRVVRDELELRPFGSAAFSPLFRFGLRGVLFFVVLPMMSFSAIAAFTGGAYATLLFFMVLNAAFATVMLVLPTQPLVERVREWRTAELGRVEAAIAGDRRALDGSPLGTQLSRVDVVGLLLYRREVTDLRALPFDGGAFARFALYVLLPPMSWVAAALVERWVDKALG